MHVLDRYKTLAVAIITTATTIASCWCIEKKRNLEQLEREIEF